jgi:hypothetical protein
MLWQQERNSEFVRAVGHPREAILLEGGWTGFNHVSYTYSKLHLRLILKPPLCSYLIEKVGLTSWLYDILLYFL